MVASSRSPDAFLSTGFVAGYTAKDLILYALSLGFGSSLDELQYVYEHDPGFSAVPTFPLVLPFWANMNEALGISHCIQAFPPPLMMSMGVLPKKLWKSELPSDLPVIHVRQSIEWHRALPVQQIRNHEQSPVDGVIQTNLDAQILSVNPKSIGTFVTTETTISSSGGSLICTLISTNLVLGATAEYVHPYGSIVTTTHKHPSMGSEVRDTRPHDFEWRYTVGPTQALLYRMASGDSNVIHVDPSTMPDMGNGAGGKPLLQGICTLGIATRAILKYMKLKGLALHFSRLDVQFTKPVFVGDRLTIRIWENSINESTDEKGVLLFTVMNSETDETLVDHGRVLLVKQLPDSQIHSGARL